MGVLTRLLQAASAIENFKMDSPIKKLNFDASNKENQALDESTIAAMTNKEKVVETKKDEVKVAKKSEEIDEPLLQENPHRFVLFPIKYHEVCDASPRVKWPPRVEHLS